MTDRSRSSSDADRVISELEKHLLVLREGIRKRSKRGDSQWAMAAAEGFYKALEELRATQKDLKLAREQAERDRQRYRDLFEFAPDCYIVTDAHGSVREANHTALKLLNIRSDYLVGKPLVVFLERARSEQERFFHALMLLRHGDSHAEGLLRIRGRNREPIAAHFRAAAVRQGDGRLELVRWLFRDATEQLRVQAEMNTNREKLRELAVELSQAEQHERRRIADGIHDNAIQTLALAKMMLSKVTQQVDGTVGEQVAQSVQIIGRAMDQLRTLIFELSPPVLYELGLTPGVEWLADLMKRRHGIPVEVRSDLLPNTLPYSLREALFQTIRELLMNVQKHASAGHAAVVMRKSGKMLGISVMDDGAGMEPVRRADDRQGFGIFSVQNRIELMGGSFRIRTRKGRGTCVRMLVPLDFAGHDGKNSNRQEGSRDDGSADSLEA